MADQQNRFCEQCGQPLSPTARFCGSCGRPAPELGDTQPVRRAGASQAVPPSAQPVPPQPPQVSPSAPTVLVPRYQPVQPQPAPAAPLPQPNPAQYVPPVPQPVPPAPRPQPPQYIPPAPQPLQPAPFQQPNPAAYFSQIPPQAAPAEPIFGVIPGAVRKRGFLGMGRDQFTLVITPFRIIFANQTSKMVQDEYQRAKEAAKQQGKGFLGQWGAMLTTHIGQKYLSMPVGAILSEQPNNFFIANNQVKSVKIHHNFDEESTRNDYDIVIDTVSGKFRLDFGNLDEKGVRNLLRQSLGALVK